MRPDEPHTDQPRQEQALAQSQEQAQSQAQAQEQAQVQAQSQSQALTHALLLLLTHRPRSLPLRAALLRVRAARSPYPRTLPPALQALLAPAPACDRAGI
mmetsp:Transcript_3108/g.7208  ORF Transcript_3108/g.7208 Transcript_3108/m.7208 type:complete len:100 (+) Transcript_3108:142-441(+)